jgi:L-asparaginase II
MNDNPIIAEVTRGEIVESQHRGAFVVLDCDQRIALSAGNLKRPIFPRSAIKAFQALPLIESGAAKTFGLNEAEIALACSSHNGEALHVTTALSTLQKCGCGEQHLECGAHWPSDRQSATALVLAGNKPSALHNNCSGKHAGMIAACLHLGFDPRSYVEHSHPLQQVIARRMGEQCDVDLSRAPVGIDGCSVPTWAYPLHNMALGFARLAALDCEEGVIITKAAQNHPYLIAGSERFDTKIMQAVPRLFIKVGAEGVFGGCIPHAGLGFSLKCDDGASRAAEVAIANALSKLPVWTNDESAKLKGFALDPMSNWRKRAVGETRST